MARVAGVEIPDNKRVEIALTYIYGIGRSTSQKILTETGISPDKRVKELTDEELARIRDYIDRNLTVEGDLRRKVAEDIKRLIDIR
ncbi:MAG: 30S ribosomal protein S13, partial [Armatimonadetes bacterium]|nr:30S ribosomal protein S13 [Armatimonadota bacterium]